MKSIILISAFIFFFFSCKKENKINKTVVSYSHNLVSNNKIKYFDLDSETRYNAFYLYSFTDDKGKDYLSFLNYRSNQILFYDMETCKFLFKVDFDREGANGISLISGYYVKDFNNIYVSSYSYAGLLKVDTTKRIIQKIPYGTTNEGYPIVPSYTPSSHPYVPPIAIDNKLYITQMAADHIYPISKTPLTVAIDTTNLNYEQLPLTYDILTSKQQQTEETRFSRIFNDENFIYSFYIDNNIFITSIDHTEVNKIAVKSRYIDNIPNDQPIENSQIGAKIDLEVARYGDLVYDKYRDVYYRFAYPNTSLDNNEQWRGRSIYGRKKFSIIILDNKFNIIGETLFPESIYNSFVFFINKEGLYISRDYQINYEQSEDCITFELFNIRKNIETNE